MFIINAVSYRLHPSLKTEQPNCVENSLAQRKAHINSAFAEAEAGRRAMEPLVVRETNQGAFERLDFVEKHDH